MGKGYNLTFLKQNAQLINQPSPSLPQESLFSSYIYQIFTAYQAVLSIQ